MSPRPTYKELERRCLAAESALEAIRSGQADTVISDHGALVLRLKEAQAAAQEAEIKYQVLAETSPDIIYIIDLKTFKTNYLNRKTLLGYTVEELEKPGSLTSNVHPDDLPVVNTHWAEIMSGGAIREADYRLKSKDGTWEWLNSRPQILSRDADGKPMQALVNLNIITNRKQIEEALRRSEEKFSSAFMSNPAALLLTRLADGLLLDVNVAYCRLAGFSRDELLGHRSDDFKTFVYPTRLSDLVEELSANGPNYNREITIQSRAGELRMVLASMEKLNFNNEECILITFVDITDRKQAQADLLAAQQFNRSTIDGLKTPLCVLDATGTVLNVNRAWREFADANPPAPENYGVGSNYLEICEKAEGTNSEEAGYFAAGLRPVLKGASTGFDMEYACHSPKGEQRWFIAHVSRFFSGGRMMVVITHEDITIRKLSEERIRTSELRFRALIEHGRDNISLVTADGTLVWESPSQEHMLGYAYNEFYGRDIFDLLHPDDLERVQAQFAGILAMPGNTENGVFRLKHADGTWRWAEGNATNLLNMPNVGAVVINYRDVTERKQAEEALVASEARFRALFEDVPIAIWEQDFSEVKKYLDSLKAGGVTDLRAYFAEYPEELLHCEDMIRILDVNQSAVRMYEANDKEELIHATMRGTSQGELDNGVEEMVAIAERETSHFWEGSDETMQGRPITIHVNWSVVPGFEGDFSRIIVTTADITESKRIEEELRRSENRYRLATQATNDVIWEWNAATHELNWTENVKTVFGYTSHEAGPDEKWWDEHIHPEDRERILSNLNAFLEGNATNWADEYRFRRKDGSYAFISDHSYIERDLDGKPLRMIGAMSDITERKHDENQLKNRADEFAALYETTQGLSTELDVSKLLKLIVERTNQLLESTGGFIYLYDPAQNDLVLATATDAAMTVGVRLKMGEGMAGRVAVTCEPLIVDDYQAWAGRADVYKNDSYRSIVEVPMLSGGELIGVLGVEIRGDSSRKFNEQDARLLSLFAGYVSGAVRNARLLESLQNELAERRQAEAALAASEGRFRALFEDVPIPIWEEDFSEVKKILDSLKAAGVTDFHAYFAEHPEVAAECSQKIRVLDVNRAALKLFKAESKAELIETTSSEISPGEAEHNHEDFIAIAEGRSGNSWEGVDTTLMGEVIQISLAWSVVPGFEGDYARVILTTTDITERKQAEDALRASEETFHGLFNSVAEAIYIQDVNGRFLDINEGVLQMYGHPKEFLIGNTPEPLSAPGRNNLPEVAKAVEAAFKGEPQQFEFWGIRSNGEVFPKEVRLYKGTYFGQNVVIALAQDITERKQAEETLRRSEALLGEAQKIGRIGHWEWTAPGRDIIGSDELFQIFEIPPKPDRRISQNVISDMLTPEEHQRLTALDRTAFVNRADIDYEYQVRLPSGRSIWLHQMSKVNYGEDGKPLRMMGIIQDITERKQAEMARERLLNVLEASLNEIYIFDPENLNFEYVNSGALLNLGYSFEELKRMTPVDLKPEFTEASFREVIAPLLQHEKRTLNFETVHRRADSSLYPVDVHLQLVETEEGSAFLAVINDITERKQAQETLSQQLGELELLYQSGLALSSELEPKQVAEKLIEALETKMDWHHIAIRKYDPERDRLEVLSFKQPSLDNKTQMQAVEERFNEAVTNSSTGLSGWAVRHGQTVRSGNVKADERYTETYPDIQSGLYAPMTLGERVVGVISVESEGLNAFTESDERLLKTVANQAAVAFENARLFQGLQHELVERIQAETARLQSEERYRQTLDTMMEGCQIIGFDWQYLYINEKAAQQGRFSREALLGHIMPEMYPGIEATNMFGVLRECMESRLACRMENEFHYGDGTTGWFDLSIQPVPEGIFILSVDITERKQAEQALRASEERMRLTLQTTSDGFWIVNQEGNFIEVNNAYCEMSGYSRSELLKMRIPDVEALESLEGTQSHIARIESERHERFETRHRRKDGSEFDVEFTVNLLDEDTGLFICFCRDITERKRAEQALRESEARLGDAARIAHFGYWDRDFIAQTITLSEEACQIFGISAQYRFFNLPKWHEQWLQLIHPEDRSRVEEILKDALSGGLPYNVDYRVIRPDGDIRHVHSFADLTRDEFGKPIRLFGTMIDITERKLAEREILNRTQDLTLINALNEAANRGESIETITNVFSQEAYSIFNCRDAAVYLLSPDGKYLEMQNNSISHELTKRIEEFIGVSIPRVRLPVNEGGHTKYLLSRTEGVVTDDPIQIQKWMFEFTESTFLPNVLREPIRAIIPRVFDLLGIRSIITIPLVSSGQTIGLMDFSSAGQFTNEDLARLIPISRQMTAILLRKQAESVVETQLRRITALNDIDRAIGSSLDMRLSLEVLLKEVVTQLGVDAADILLMNPVDLALEYFAGRGFRTSAIRQTRMTAGQGVTGKSVLEKKVVHVPNLRDAESEVVRKSLLKGEDFVEYFGVPLVAKGTLKGVLEIFNRAPLVPDPDWLTYLETLGGQAAIAIDNAQLFEGLQTSNQELMAAYDATIAGWSHAMDLRDEETEGHTQRVTELTRILAIRMGVSEQDQIHMRRGALLHDIGKLGVPDHILLKPGPLTPEEWEVMHKHPTYAFKMLLPITYLQPALDIPYCHHEKWDGSGYPRGLKGEQIPLAARIFAVVDVWDALRSDRPYRPGWSAERVRDYIRNETGKHFDPNVVGPFLTMLDELPDPQ